MRIWECVAALRRKLPLDTEVEDYILHEGPTELDKDGPFRQVRLSELFADPSKPLVFYQLMFGGAQKKPCTMCSLWIDGFNGIGHHLRQRLNFAVIAEAGIGELRQVARQRGWSNLRMVSSAGSNFKLDLKFQDNEGNQLPGVSVFVLSNGAVRHFLTPEGRGDWMPKLQYE